LQRKLRNSELSRAKGRERAEAKDAAAKKAAETLEAVKEFNSGHAGAVVQKAC
jgi:dsRNA-specific ribonuclease